MSNTTADRPASKSTSTGFTISVHDLERFSMNHLHVIQDGLYAALWAAHGIMLQPRADFESDSRSGEWLEEFCEFLGLGLDLVADVARRATLTQAPPIEDRAWLLLQRQAAHKDDLPGFAALAAKLAAELAHANQRVAA